MDFAKAFDRVSYLLLVNTLNMLGIGEHPLSWICSYLVDRKQQVITNGHPFNLSTPFCGVPQGAVLSQLLFSLLINSAPFIIQHVT